MREFWFSDKPMRICHNCVQPRSRTRSTVSVPSMKSGVLSPQNCYAEDDESVRQTPTDQEEEAEVTEHASFRSTPQKDEETSILGVEEDPLCRYESDGGTEIEWEQQEPMEDSMIEALEEEEEEEESKGLRASTAIVSVCLMIYLFI